MKKSMSVIAVVLLLFLCFGVSFSNSNITEAETIEISSEDVIAKADNTFTSVDWKKDHYKVRGLYVTGPTAGSERMEEIIDIINNSEANAIVLDVKDDSGNITFNMDNPMVAETGACIPYISDIETLIKTLKNNDIYVIGRVPCFKDPILAESRPELALKTSDGEPVTDAKGNAWVNPCSEEVWTYITSIATTCCELGFDEIQLDYVRFPVGQNAEQAIYGAPTADEDRQGYINQFLNKVSEAVHEYNKPVSADVFGTIIKSKEDSAHVGQDYLGLSCALDIICPMVYPSHYAAGEFGLELPDAMPYETIYAAMEGSQNVLSKAPDDKKAVVRPWLQAFTATWIEDSIEYNGAAINKQIQAVYDAGYDEWILWNSRSDYSAGGF